MDRRLSGHATWHHTHDGWNVAVGACRVRTVPHGTSPAGVHATSGHRTRDVWNITQSPAGVHTTSGHRTCDVWNVTHRKAFVDLRVARGVRSRGHCDLQGRTPRRGCRMQTCQTGTVIQTVPIPRAKANCGNGTPSQQPGEGTSGVDPQRLVAVSTRPRGQQPMWAFQPQRVSERRHPGRVGCTPIKPCFERRKFRPPGRPGLAASHTQYTAGARGHLASRRRRPPSAAPQSPGFERPCSFAAACHCLELIVEGVLAAFRLELVVALDAAAALDAVVALDAARHSMRFSARRSRAAHALRR